MWVLVHQLITFLMCWVSPELVLSASSSEVPCRQNDFIHVPVTPELKHDLVGHPVADLQGTTIPVMVIVRRHVCISVSCGRCFHLWVVNEQDIQPVVQLETPV